MINGKPFQGTAASNADLLLAMATVLHAMAATGASNGQVMRYLEVIRAQIDAAIEVLSTEYK